MSYIKTFESYSDQEYFSSIEDGLEKYNVSPEVISKILMEYQDQIVSDQKIGKDPQTFINKIVKDLELDSGGYMPFKVSIPNAATTIKYI
jgi:hypothetical protein